MDNKLSFPKVRKVIIDNFSLYTLVDRIEIEVNEGVFCLAGANGLGKSTFISILNYGLTGIVINPRKNFASINQISKYYKENKKFADEYFDGRIDEYDRERATVALVFELGEHEYHIKRRFFEQDELLYFYKVKRGDSVVYEENHPNPKELNSRYQTDLINDLQLEAFDQFVFLLYFLFTFDESRRLLFWDISVLSRILHLVFGTDAAKAERVDFLKKEVARNESHMRNLQNAIYKDEKALADVYAKLNKIETSDSSEVIVQYEELSERLSEQLSSMKAIEADLKECSLKNGDFSLQINSLRTSYSQLFETYYQAKPIEKNEKVIALLHKLKNIIRSGSDADAIACFSELKKIISETQQVEDKSASTEGIEELQNIDSEIYILQKESDENLARQARLISEKSTLQETILTTQSELKILETDNQDIISKYSNPQDSQAIQNFIKSYQDVIDLKKKEKEKDTAKRDVLRKELGELEKELSIEYAKVEEQFIPIFSNYANSFLGLEISIKPQRLAQGFNISLSVNNNERAENFQLSESQRYFIDIALRMALIEYWCEGGTVFIDTPEGSLDIAYESKAGKMFADFALKRFDIVMTANINTSQLLVQMADKCKKEKMRLERMTDWTTLSTVQQEEHDKILAAYKDIEKVLGN